MIGRISRTSSLFYVAFDKQASLIKDDLLEPLDALLDDEALIAIVADGLGRRRPGSRRTGREGIAPDRLLRCAVLKQIKGWSLRELEREVRSSLVYRRFTRFDEAKVPRHCTFSRAFAAIGDERVREIHGCVVERARKQGVAKGRKLRTDTTVTESNIHHPTDSTLLQDGVRVLSRTIRRFAEACDSTLRVVDHGRAVKHRVLEITRAAKSFTKGSREDLQRGYRRLLGITRGVVRQAEQVQDKIRQGKLRLSEQGLLAALIAGARLDHFVPLVKRVVAQTKARVFGGNTHVVDKIVSIFEEHTQVIRKGKAHKPTEFGRLVRIDEVENGVVSNYELADANPADATAWVPSVSQHREIFGRAPYMATGDRGFFSASNEQRAEDLGVRRVVLPARGPLSKGRKKTQRQRWFKRALRWRGGIEGRIGTLKHRFGMARARSKGDGGFKRDVGWSIITNNLVAIARTKKAEGKVARDVRR